MIKKLTLTCSLLIVFAFTIKAQTRKPFVYNISEDGSRYVKFGLNAQLWSRYTQLDPGSQIGSNVTNQAFDLVIRRLRAQVLGMLTKKVFFHFQVGQNNINFTQNNGPYNSPLSILDLLGEYRFNKMLHVGVGLNGWGAGTTRYSSQSSSSQLSVDSPIYQQNNISSTFGNRNMSLYAKGQIKKISYSVAITNPYKHTTNSLGEAATISTRTPNAQYLGMVTYNFFDKESIDEPYAKGTYLGTKKILNVAAGYMYQAKAMWRLSENGGTVYEDMKVFGADIFFDTPINSKGAALTLYGAYNNCNYGKDYLRLIATPNPASKGPGSGFYGIGTGQIYYAQAGYLFNHSKNESIKGRPQIYVCTEYANLQALNKPMTMFEAGINYYITGTFGPKVTLGYQNRGIFKPVAGQIQQVSNGRRGMLVLQYQICF